MSDIYKFDCKNAEGEVVSLSDYKNRLLLIVNTASKCGFTPQYEGLNNLHLKFKDKDFSVLGFPCNQFGKQEPGTNEEIQEFCSLNFQIEFPVFAKIDVNGPTKFLVDQKGNVVSRFAPNTKPEDIEKEIKAII